MEKLIFESPTTGALTVPQMIKNISEFVKSDTGSFYSLVIGTDSLTKTVNGVKQCDFVTAVVVHKVGSGARYFWRREKMFRHPSLREKIYTETLTSLEIANALVPEIKARLAGALYELEIHIDVGNVGPTRVMIKEVVGMVTGNGFSAKIKPYSWAASTVADKYT